MKMDSYVVGPDKYSIYQPNFASRNLEYIERGSPEPLVISTTPTPPSNGMSAKNICLLTCGGLCCLIIFCITAVFFAFFVFNSGPFGPGVYKTARIVEGFSIG
uniref:Uncharacterized protein n=1 Tax=Acrobeloides nanus TaxID=290746 RepID=A0A914DI25_9BILA